MATAPSDRPRPGRARRALATLLIVLSCIGMLASILAVWTARTVLDSDRFAAAVDRSLQTPEVIDAAAAFITREASNALVDSDVVENVLPDDLSGLAPVIERGLTGVISQQATAIVSSDAGRELIVNGVRTAHAAVMRLLEGEIPTGGAVVVEDGRVSLDLVPLISRVLDRLGQLDAIDIDRPIVDRDGPLAERLAALSESLGIELPDDYGQLVVYDQELGPTASAIGSARRALELFRTAVWLILLVTLLLIALALFVAPDRRRALIWLGTGAAVTGLLAHLLIRRVSEAVLEVITDPVARSAAAEVIRETVTRLDSTVVALALIGSVLVLLLTFVSAERAALASRWLRDRAVRSPDLIRVAGVAIGMVILLWAGLDPLPLLAALAVVAIAFGVTARLVRSAAPTA